MGPFIHCSKRKIFGRYIKKYFSLDQIQRTRIFQKWFVVSFFFNISVSQFNSITLKTVKALIGQCKNLATLKLLSRKLFIKHRYKTWYSAKKDRGRGWSVICCSLVTKALLENKKKIKLKLKTSSIVLLSIHFNLAQINSRSLKCFMIFSERMYFYSHRSSWLPNWKCMLGVILLGTPYRQRWFHSRRNNRSR